MSKTNQANLQITLPPFLLYSSLKSPKPPRLLDPNNTVKENPMNPLDQPTPNYQLCPFCDQFNCQCTSIPDKNTEQLDENLMKLADVAAALNKLNSTQTVIETL